MKMRKDISIVPARGGFVMEYMNVGPDELSRFGLVGSGALEHVTEVVPSEAKMIKRLREILIMQAEYEKTLNQPQQLNEELG